MMKFAVGMWLVLLSILVALWVPGTLKLMGVL